MHELTVAIEKEIESKRQLRKKLIHEAECLDRNADKIKIDIFERNAEMVRLKAEAARKQKLSLDLTCEIRALQEFRGKFLGVKEDD